MLNLLVSPNGLVHSLSAFPSAILSVDFNAKLVEILKPTNDNESLHEKSAPKTVVLQ
jgi:hypothetical protein